MEKIIDTQPDSGFNKQIKVIPSTCYENTLEAAARLSGPLRELTFFDHLLNFAGEQLDPSRVGLSVILVLCTRPLAGQKVRSLRIRLCIGTSPLFSRLHEERILYLGSESLAGQAVMAGRPCEVKDIRYTPQSSWQGKRNEVSALACPIQRNDLVAGCLLVFSVIPAYFTEERKTLIRKYSDLACMAFDDDAYFARSEIVLHEMPHAEVQEPILRHFNRYVSRNLARGGTSRIQAESKAYLQLEEKLISSSSILPSRLHWGQGIRA